MLRLTHQLLIFSLLALCTVSLALGQEVIKDRSNETQIITASVTPNGVRIAAPSAVVQLRLEVYDEAGQKLLDTEQRGGNVLDWRLQGGAGERVADGTYLYVVTIKNLSGQLSKKLGLVTLSAESTKLRPAGLAELSPGQTQAVGPIEGEDEGLSMMPAENASPVTLLANNGDDAQLARTRGALSFRKGDFFSGTDKEQMRLTEEGNLGIGTSKPKAKLDVAGMIRAREGFTFSDGSKLDVNEKGVLSLTSSKGDVVPNIAGSGTQNKLAKWTDAAGSLGDAGIFEKEGLVVIGQNGSGETAPLAPGSGQYHALEVGVPVGSKSPLTLAGGSGIMEFWKDLGGGIAAPAAAVSFGMAKPGTPASNDMVFSSYTKASTVWNERMRLTTAGNLGIGTTSPGAKLDVTGDANVSSNLIVDTNALFVDAANDRVGIGTAMPTAGLNVRSDYNLRNAVLIENGNNASGDVTSAALWIKNLGLGGLVFRADDTLSDTTPFIIDHSGNVGIGTTSPGAKLDVAGNMNVNGGVTAAGKVESTSGGFKFPDGSIQTSAAGRTYTTFPFSSDVEIGQPGGGSVSILHLDLPAGSYMVTATVQFENRGLFNKRLVSCQLINEATWFFRIEGSGGAMDQLPMTMHTVITQGGGVDLRCAAIDGSGRSNIFARARRFTAIRLGDLVTQP